MKKLIYLTTIFSTFLFYSQQKVTIFDFETKKPIPYAKITFKDKQYYKNTEENGEITLVENEIPLEIKTFGYENLNITKIQSNYYLIPKYENISAINIKQPIFKNSLTIGEIVDEHLTFGGMAANWTVANYFPFYQNYTKTPYIKSVKFISKIKSKNKGTIKLVFYKSIDGKPDNEVWKSYNIECKNNNTEFVLDKPIRFPEDGVYIGFEWINDKRNLYKQKTYYKDLQHYDNTNFNIVSINYQKSTNDEIWIFGKIIWNNPDDRRFIGNNFTQLGWLTYKDYFKKTTTSHEVNRRLSIQLKLTD